MSSIIATGFWTLYLCMLVQIRLILHSNLNFCGDSSLVKIHTKLPRWESKVFGLK